MGVLTHMCHGRLQGGVKEEQITGQTIGGGEGERDK